MNGKWFSCRLFLRLFFGIIAPSILAQHTGEISSDEALLGIITFDILGLILSPFDRALID